MKRAYLADGIVVSSVTTKDAVLYVDDTLFSYLQSVLEEDYCYLTLAGTEIVKILAIEPPNSVLVKRGVGGIRTYAASGASLKYSLTTNELEDAITETILTIVGGGALTVEENNIFYSECLIQGLGGVKVSSETNRIVITDIAENAGCNECIPPEIPIQFQSYRIIDSGETRTTDDGSIRSYI